MLDKVISMGPATTEIFPVLSDTNNKMKRKLHEMKLELKNCEAKKKLMRSEIEKLTNVNEEILRNRDFTRKKTTEITEMIPTSYHNTICYTHSSLCHEQCGLEYNQVRGSEVFRTCACMSGSNCHVCGCDFSSHFHQKAKPMKRTIDIDDIIPDKKKKYDEALTSKSAIDNAVNIIQQEINNMDSETSKTTSSIVTFINKLKSLVPKFMFSLYTSKREEIQESILRRRASEQEIEDLEIERIVYRKINEELGISRLA